jgi:hypothetical protein
MRLHPNLFVFLVGPPGTGKSVAMSPGGSILRKSGAVTLAPNDVTKQGLLDVMANSGKAVLFDPTPENPIAIPMDYHFLALRIGELSNFMSQYDAALAGLLTDLYDCGDVNDEHKRGHDKGKSIPFPGISMLVGTATQNLGNTISDALWGSGFMARVIMVYSDQKVIPKDMFRKADPNEVLRAELVDRFKALKSLKGPMIWTPEAQAQMYEFRLHADREAPLHNRLTHYHTRRWAHLAKLCMISALQDERMEVDTSDIQTAKEWLLAAELDMPEIFKDMQTHEDGHIYEEMRHIMHQAYMSSGRKPVHVSVLVKWLSSRVASHAVMRMIDIAVAADLFRRCIGTEGADAEYVPQPPKGSKDLGVM